MKKIISIITFFALFAWTTPISAAMSGGNFSIPVDSFSVTEDNSITGGDYSLDLTAGESYSGDISETSFTAKGGFQAMVQSSLDYSLNKSAISLSFGSSPLSVVASDSLITTVTTDSLTGYSLLINASGNLASGSNDINNVSDGDVTAGSEEYGIRTTGTDGLLATDTAISGSVSVASANIPVSSSATTITFRAGASTATKAGTYTQALTFTITANP